VHWRGRTLEQPTFVWL